MELNPTRRASLVFRDNPHLVHGGARPRRQRHAGLLLFHAAVFLGDVDALVDVLKRVGDPAVRILAQRHLSLNVKHLRRSPAWERRGTLPRPEKARFVI